MLDANPLENLVNRLVPALRGVYTADRLKELLQRYRLAYADLEPTDELDNCLRPGANVEFSLPGISQTTGMLVVALRQSTQSRERVEWKVTHGIIRLPDDRHVRVAWEKIRRQAAENQGPGAAL
jgi:hypothetical protein